MFVGEFTCLIAFYIVKCVKKNSEGKKSSAKPFSPFIFILPSLCDMTATSMMYIGLTLVNSFLFPSTIFIDHALCRLMPPYFKCFEEVL